MEDWEADSMLTTCQPWEARDFHQLDKRAHSTDQEKYIIIHIQMKNYTQEKPKQNKKGREWETNKVAEESTSTSSFISLSKYALSKSPTS